MDPDLAAQLAARNIPPEFLDNPIARKLLNTITAIGDDDDAFRPTYISPVPLGTQEENAAALRKMMQSTAPDLYRDRQEARPSSASSARSITTAPRRGRIPSPVSGEGAGGEGVSATTPPSAPSEPSSQPLDGHRPDRSLPSAESEADRSTVPSISAAAAPAPRCAGQNRHGEACRAQRVKGSEFCFHHNSATAAVAHEVSARAGATPRTSHAAVAIPFNFSTYTGLQAGLETLVRLELAGVISPDRAASINRTLTIAARNLHAGFHVIKNYDERRDELLEHIDTIEVANTMADHQESEARNHSFRNQVKAYYEAADDFGILENLTPKRPRTPTIPRR